MDRVQVPKPSTPPEKQTLIDQAPRNADGQPIDYRTGVPLNPRHSDIATRWLIVDGQGQWVAINPRRGWSPLNRIIDPLPLDPTAAERHTSRDLHRPGDAPAHRPARSYQRALRAGIDYLKRTHRPWTRYQLQIAGWHPHGRATPEWIQPHPTDPSKTVAFDGRTTRNNTAIYLEAKHDHNILARHPRTLNHQEFTLRKKLIDGIETQIQKQLEVLPKDALLEWHVSDPRAANFIKSMFKEMQQDPKVRSGLRLDLERVSVHYTPAL